MTDRPGWRSALGLAAASALAASVLTGLLTRQEPSTVARPPVHRYSIDLPPGARLLGSSSNNAYNPAVSPDGTLLVIAAWDQNGKRQLWRRALDGTAFEPMAGTDDGSTPAWSPDSRELVFLTSGNLMRMSRQGGSPQAIAGVETLVRGVISTTITSPDWGPDGTILMATTDGVYRTTATGGQPVRVIPQTDAPSGPTPSAYAFPRWLPRNAGFLFTTTIAGGGTEGTLEFVPLPDGRPTRLLEVRGRGWMTPDGLIVARATGRLTATLTAHRFDPATRSLEQPGVTLAADASLEFSASNTGTIVYRPGSGGTDHRVEWVDANGRVDGEGFDVVGFGPLNLSRDESLLAYMENGDILFRDLRRGVSTRLVPGPGVIEPVLSPDAQRIAYSTTGAAGTGVVIRPTAGGAPERVYEATQVALVEDWSHDGRFLAVDEGQKGLIVPLDGQQQPQTYADLPAGSNLDEPRFAPDGRWLVYNASDSGQQEVYLVPLPPTGARWQLSSAGGAQGRWRRDGRVVFYLASSGELMAVDLDLTPGARPGIGRPRTLFATGLAMTPNIDQYAPNADGTRFLLRRPAETEGTPRLNVIVNWPSLLPPP